jgi:hypothetical protein
MTYLLIFIIFSLLLYIRGISKKLRATRHELNKVKDVYATRQELNKVKDVYHKLRGEGV